MPPPCPPAIFDFFTATVSVRDTARRVGLSVFFLNGVPQRLAADEDTTLDTLMWRLKTVLEKAGGVPPVLALRPAPPFFGAKTACWHGELRELCRHYGCDLARLETLPSPVRLLRRRLRQRLRAEVFPDNAEWRRAVGELLATFEPTPVVAGLAALPAAPLSPSRYRACRVASDGFLQYRGDVYSVPSVYAGRTVHVGPDVRGIRIQSAAGEFLAQHPAGRGTGAVFLVRSHFEPSRLRTGHELRPLRTAWLAAFPDEERFFSCLLAQRRLGAAETVRSVLAATAIWPRDRLREAMRDCVRYNNYSHRFLQGLLEGPRSGSEQTEVNGGQGTLF